MTTEWALHLRDPEGGRDPIPTPTQVLCEMNHETCPEQLGQSHAQASCFSRIYVGDEFCANRMPLPADMGEFFGIAERNGTQLTLLTPILTDEELDGCVPLLDCLAGLDPRCEIVVNDWGVLSFLRESYPEFRLAVGRVLNKAFKDPRLKIPEGGPMPAAGFMELLRYSTFSRPEFQGLLQGMGITRLEQDVLPYSDRSVGGYPGFETSVYFPFGYVTSGRVCWTASFGQPPAKRFIAGHECGRPCRNFTLELTGGEFALEVFQNGNTVFYLYTRAMLGALLNQANETRLRLVYQGLAI